MLKDARVQILSNCLLSLVYASMLPATKRRSRTCVTRATCVIFERKHCSRRRRHTQVELSSPRKCADKTQTIARKRWQGARKRKRKNVKPATGVFAFWHRASVYVRLSAFCLRIYAVTKVRPVSKNGIPRTLTNRIYRNKRPRLAGV